MLIFIGAFLQLQVHMSCPHIRSFENNTHKRIEEQLYSNRFAFDPFQWSCRHFIWAYLIGSFDRNSCCACECDMVCNLL